MNCLPCLCHPRKSAQVKRVLAEMVRQREAEDAMRLACEEALRALTARLRGERPRRAA